MKPNEKWMKDSLEYAQQHFSNNMSTYRKTYTVSGNSSRKQIMKKEFKLPEKWCIKVTEENAEVLSNWRTAGGAVNNGYLSNRGGEYCGLWDSSLPQGFQEISFEDFTIHILKQQPKSEDLSYLIDFLKQQQIT